MCIHAVAQVIPLIQIQDVPMSLCLQFLPCLSLIRFPVVKKTGVVPQRFCRQVGFGRSNVRATTISSLAQPFLELDHLFVVFIRLPIGFPW